MSRPLPRSRPLAASGWPCVIATLGLLGACGGQDESSVSGDAGTSDVSESLLSGRDALRPRMPTEGAEASQAPPSGPSTSSGPTAGDPPGTIDLALLGHDSGAPEAPVKIVEFSDFGCGYCRKFHLESYPVLEEEYIRTGKVEWKYVPMILGIFGQNAEIAAEAAECAMAQNRFEGVRDVLFERQSEWKQAQNPSAVFRGFMEEEGLDVVRWEQCMVERERRERVETGTQLAQQAGVRGTPTFFILGYAPIPGAIPLELFKQVLDTVYAQALQGGPR